MEANSTALIMEIAKECLNPRFDGWEMVNETEFARLYRRQHKSGLYEWCTYHVFNSATIENIFEAADNLEYVKHWNTSVKTAEVLNVKGQEVIHWESILPSPLANRDFVFSKKRDMVTIDGRDVYIRHVHSLNGLLPEQKGVVRVTEYNQIACGVADKEKKTSVNICNYVLNNLGGILPKWLMDFLTKVYFPKQAMKSEEAYNNYADWKRKQATETSR